MLIPDLVLIGSILDQPIRILTQSAPREFNPGRFLERLGLLSPCGQDGLAQLDGVSSFGYKSAIQRGQKHFY